MVIYIYFLLVGGSPPTCCGRIMLRQVRPV